MHLPDGIVAGHISVIGYAASFGLAIITGRRKQLTQEVTKISLVAAVLFVASIITIPMGYTTVHFSFLGLAGVILGPRAFIAVAVAVFLQLILFKHGGFSTLGINVLNLGMGALVGWLVYSGFGKAYRKETTRINLLVRGGLAGALAGVTKVGLGSGTLFYSGYPMAVAVTLFTVHIPVFVIEGIVTGLLVAALYKHRLLYHSQGKAKDETQLGIR